MIKQFHLMPYNLKFNPRSIKLQVIPKFPINQFLANKISTLLQILQKFPYPGKIFINA